MICIQDKRIFVLNRSISSLKYNTNDAELTTSQEMQLKFPQNSQQTRVHSQRKGAWREIRWYTNTIVNEMIRLCERARLCRRLTHLLGVSQARKRGLHRGRTWINRLPSSRCQRAQSNARDEWLWKITVAKWNRPSLMRLDGKPLPFPWNETPLSRHPRVVGGRFPARAGQANWIASV